MAAMPEFGLSRGMTVSYTDETLTIILALNEGFWAENTVKVTTWVWTKH